MPLFAFVLLLLTLPYTILIKKSKRELHLVKHGQVVRTFGVALGSSPIGAKEREGDRKTPEGSYRICKKNAHSNFHRSLEISYPSADDAERGLQTHRISAAEYQRIVQLTRLHKEPLQHTALGGDIFIHGGGSLHSTGRDWTWGCIALDDADIDTLFALLPLGTEVKIVK